MIEDAAQPTVDSPTTVPASGNRVGIIGFRRTAVALAVVAVGLAAAACGGGSRIGVASIGSTTTTTSPSAVIAPKGTSGSAPQLLKYTRCIQKHGEPNFPDPGSSETPAEVGASVDYDSPKFKAAYAACKQLIPQAAPLTPAESQKEQAEALKYAHCVQTHGVPNFPDPTSQGLVEIVVAGSPGNSPDLEEAGKACHSLIPRA